ncbi:phosphate ABC transporter substrate-binding protein PstS [Pseudonocardia asaccharolytica]|uniref:Phosphate-binding protein n=1 Tax=Pseudonocardia asaccharolytica DSM 44247 = NBRC 16224 TaxID=1123024 RepID=A0A511D084_9PSEU|nr:phosphate ABC transporter substrate-binding protein PstS [Pseudonocardia asaccharolytica]GEL18202.1 phosphate-binding protein PstS [Pseudonocardia asaccharolytica DSM 44247 = NBRC 16224]
MKLQRHGVVLAIAAAGALLLSACGSDPSTTVGGNSSAAANSPAVDCSGKKSLNAEGSSAQKNAMDVFTQAYQAKCQDANIAYNPTGSGAGIKQFTAGLVDFGGSDSALKESEAEAAAARCQGNPAWNLPLVFGPVAIAYNLDGVDTLTLDGETAAKIFNGTIKTWNDPAIAALNSGVNLPSTPINVVFRSDESGTTDNFQKYLEAASKGAWTQGDGKKFNGGVGSGAEKSAGVAQAVAGAPGSITYVELAYAQDNKLGMAQIDNGAGAVALNDETVGKAIEAAKIKGTGNDLALDLKSVYGTTAAGEYPLILATYEVVCSKGYDVDTAKAVKAFLTVAATDGQANLSEAGYAKLPAAFQQKLLTSIQAIGSGGQ